MNAQTEQWHEDRLKGLGGSDIAAALGISQYKTQLQLWGEKTKLAPSEFTGNEFTYWGTAIEPLLAARFIDEHIGEFLLMVDIESKAHNKHSFLRANVDGLIHEADGDHEKIGIWEAKTASRVFTEVPLHYQLQVQHYMYVYDLDFAIFSVLFGGNNYQEFRVDRDSAYESDVLPKLIEFWWSVEYKLPHFKVADLNDLTIKYPDFDPNSIIEVEIGSEAEKFLSGIKIAQEAFDECKKSISKIKANLTELMIKDDIKTLKVNGKAVATIVTVGSSVVFDAAALKKERPDVHKAYCTKKRSGYTSLRVSK